MIVLMIILWIGLIPAGNACAGDVPSDGPHPAASSWVTLRSAATVTGSEIRLKDVIESESNAHLPADAKDLVLMSAPAPGNDKFLSGKWVASVIRTRGRFTDSTVIAAPEQIHIRRAHQTLPQGQLEDFFYNYVARRLEDPDFKVTGIKVRGTDQFPVGAVSLHVLEPEPRQVTGRVNLRVMVKVDGEKFGWLTLSGWVERYETVVCTTRYLPRGTVLEADDLDYKRMNTSRLPAGVIREPDLAVGKRLKRNLKIGSYLRQNMLSVPPLIQKGDKVNLIARSGNIKIVTFGIAKNAAGLGEQIRIENVGSKKTIVGRVMDASTVDVIF